MSQWHWVLRQRLIGAFIFIFPVLVFIATARLFSDVGRPFPGFYTFYNTIVNQYQVDEHTPIWWEARRTGVIKQQSQVQLINGQPFAQAPQVIQAAYQRGEKDVQITYEHYENWGKRVTVTVRIDHFTFAKFLDLKAPDLIFAVGLWLVAWAVFRARPTDSLNQSAALTGLFLAFGHGINFSSLYWHEDWIPKSLDLISNTCLGSTGAATIWMVMQFARNPNHPIRRLLVVIGVVLGGYVAALWVIARLVLWTQGWSPYAAELDSIAYYQSNQFNFFTVFIFYSYTFLFIIRFSKDKNLYPLRRIAFFIWLGCIFILPTVFFNGFNRLFSGDFSLFIQQIDLRYLMVLIPFLIGLSIVRFQLLKVNSFAFTLVPLIIFSSVASNINMAFVRTFDIVGLEPSYVFLPTFIAFLVISLLIYGLVTWRNWLGARLFRSRHNKQKLTEFGDALLKKDLSEKTLPSEIVRLLIDRFDLDTAQIWLIQKPRKNVLWSTLPQSAAEPPSIQPPPPLKLMERDQQNLLEGGGVWRVNFGAVPLPGALSGFPISESLALILRLSVGNELIGVLALGRRGDGDILSNEDVDMLRLTSQQIALFIRMTRRADEKVQMNTDIHNETKQSFVVLERRIELLTTINLEQIPQLANTMQTILRDGKQTLNDILGGHYVKKIEDIPDLIQKFKADYPTVEVDYQLDTSQLRLDWGDQFTTVYRWIKEGLNNIGKHAQAGNAWVSIHYDTGCLTITIADDGVGMSESTTKNGQYGLTDIEQSVISRGGTFTCNPRSPNGTQIEIKVNIE
jgi:signal transduction histidine kinase